MRGTQKRRDPAQVSGDRAKECVWPLGIAVGACLFYGIFVAGQSEMLIRYDAIEYRNLGDMLAHQGLEVFLATGPHREPGYPFLIAAAMRLGETLQMSWQSVLAGLQVLMLSLSQVLLWQVLGVMRIRPWIRLTMVMSFGLSPAVLNSALSLFSEIAVYPFVLLAALGAAYAWEAARQKRPLPEAALLALLTALAFIAAVAVKGIFQYVFFFYLGFLALYAVGAWGRGMRDISVRTAVVMGVAAVIGLGAINGYKGLNKKYNGHFELTDRYTGLLYGNAAKRAQVSHARGLLAQAAAIPGGGVCRRWFTEEECRWTEFAKADLYWQEELPGLLNTVPPEQQKAATLRLFLEKVGAHPGSYIFIGTAEALKLLFWESTQIGFVRYPLWLDRIYTTGLFKDGLRFLAGVLTSLGLIGTALVLLWRPRRDEAPSRDMAGFLLGGVLVFMALHAPFSVVTRYALPMVPLYLALIAYTLEHWIPRRNGHA